MSAASAQVQAQTAPFRPAEVVSWHPESGGDMAGGATQPTISALGHIVAFQAGFTARTQDQPMFRERQAAITGLVNPPTGDRPVLSDDGCVIAYSRALGFYEYDRELISYNRCSGASTTLDTFNVYVAARIEAPAVSADGSVVAFAVPEYEYAENWNIAVWSNGALVNTIPPPQPGFLFDDLSVSDDGNTLAFTSGPEEGDYGYIAFAERNVYVYNVRSPGHELISRDPAGAPLGRSDDASISGDGSLVVFRSAGEITVRDRSAGANRIVSTTGFGPSISRDGRHIAFMIGMGCEDSRSFVTRSSDRWLTRDEPELIGYLLPTVTDDPCHDSVAPVITEHGRWVAWWTYDAHLFVEDPRITVNSPEHVLVRQQLPVLTVDSLDFGALSGPVDRRATVRNVGPAGWRVTSISASGPAFAVVGEDCPAVLHPGQTCSVRVRYTPSGEGQQTGQLVVDDDSYPGVPLSASGRLVGVSDPDEPPPDPDPDPDPDPEPDPVAGFGIAPNPVTFDEVVVGAAAPDRTATVSNTGQTAVTVQSVGASGAAAPDFSIVDDGCTTETLDPGDSCSVDLRFVPTDAGSRTATLTVTAFPPGAGLLTATTRLQGAGRFDAVLRVTPEAASGGQVVTVAGSGYPASSTVGVVVGGGPPVDVTTDAAGGFLQPWLVMTGTPQGELIADDVAVAGRYDAEPVPVIIIGTPVRPQATAVMSRTGRRHVSR